MRSNLTPCKLSWLYKKQVLLRLLWFVFLWSEVSFATVDGGHTAELLGTAQGGRIAIIAENSVQESCQYEACAVYLIDTQSRKFARSKLVQLQGRYRELSAKVCEKPRTQECSQKVSGLLLKEEQEVGSGAKLTLARYRARLSIWERAALGKITAPPTPITLKASDALTVHPAAIVLSEVGKVPFHLWLTERWSAPSFRATDEQEQNCDPAKVSGCYQKERWEDGARQQAWSCPAPEPKARDCSGRASFVRVEAASAELRPKDTALVSEGRSNWVEPGVLAQAAMGADKARAVDLQSLGFARHGIRVYRLGKTVLVVGGFAHGMFANGTWFPLVVAVPDSL